MRILTLSGEVGILTLRSGIPELLVRKIGNRDKVRIRVIALVSSLLIILNGGKRSYTKDFLKSFIVLYAYRICPEHHFVENRIENFPSV